MATRQRPSLPLADLGEALVGLQRVAAGGDEIDHGVEVAAGQRRVGRGGLHLAIELVGEERLAAGAAEDVLRQHVERAGAQRRRVLGVVVHRADRGAAFQHLEAVGRNQHAARRLVEPVVGAADALQQARGALRRADIDDEIDVAPVDAEIERGGADHGAQPARGHRVLDLAALRHVERAVMQRDREVVVVDAPQLLEDHLGLAAGVDEHQRRLVLLDQLVDLAEARGAPNGRPTADARRASSMVTSGSAPPSATTRSASASPLSRLRHEEAATDPRARRRWRRGRSLARPGASCHSRARPSDSRSPRFEVTSACNSSSTTRRRVPNR